MGRRTTFVLGSLLVLHYVILGWGDGVGRGYLESITAALQAWTPLDWNWQLRCAYGLPAVAVGGWMMLCALWNRVGAR